MKCIKCNRKRATEGCESSPICKQCYKKIFNNSYYNYMKWVKEFLR